MPRFNCVCKRHTIGSFDERCCNVLQLMVENALVATGTNAAPRVQEIKDRDSTISEKEKRIYDLKKKNQELEKFKFVLDHKIKELKKQVEPKDAEIAHMKGQIRVRYVSQEFCSSQNGSRSFNDVSACSCCGCRQVQVWQVAMPS